MKESYWGYWLIMLGVFIIVIMMLISNITTKNTQDYYLIKEVTEASMVDAVNYGYYREYGELKIDREKFIESFLRRFAENVSLNTYKIDFYDIYEAPPKVSVKITSDSGSFVVAGDSATFDIVNKVDAILELSGTGELPTTDSTNNTNSSTNNSSNNSNSSSSSTLPAPYAQAWYQSKYLNCDHNSDGLCRGSGVIKDEYLNNPSLFKQEIANDYEKYMGVTFANAAERNLFIEEYVKQYAPWAK